MELAGKGTGGLPSSDGFLLRQRRFTAKKGFQTTVQEVCDCIEILD
jgi:hypothetical protein